VIAPVPVILSRAGSGKKKTKKKKEKEKKKKSCFLVDDLLRAGGSEPPSSARAPLQRGRRIAARPWGLALSRAAESGSRAGRKAPWRLQDATPCSGLAAGGQPTAIGGGGPPGGLRISAENDWCRLPGGPAAEVCDFASLRARVDALPRAADGWVLSGKQDGPGP